MVLSTTSPTSLHQPLSQKSLRSSPLWCSIRISVEKRKENRLRALTSTAAPHQLSIRTNATPLVEDPRTPLPPLPKLSRPPKLVWRLRAAKYLLWRAGVTFRCLSYAILVSKRSFFFFCVILRLGLGLTPIFTVIDYYPYWIRSPVYSFLVCSSSGFQFFLPELQQPAKCLGPFSKFLCAHLRYLFGVKRSF